MSICEIQSTRVSSRAAKRAKWRQTTARQRAAGGLAQRSVHTKPPAPLHLLLFAALAPCFRVLLLVDQEDHKVLLATFFLGGVCAPSSWPSHSLPRARWVRGSGAVAGHGGRTCTLAVPRAAHPRLLRVAGCRVGGRVVLVAVWPQKVCICSTHVAEAQEAKEEEGRGKKVRGRED